MVSKETNQSNNNPKQFYYGYIVAIASFIILMVNIGAKLSFGIFFKPLLADFGLDRTTISGVASLAVIIQGFLGIIMGKINDKVGPRIVLTISGLLTGIGYLLMSQVNNLWQLYIVYGLILGVGLSGMVVPLMSTIARWFSRRTNSITGIVTSGGSVGALLVPLLISQLIDSFDWRSSYLILGGSVLVLITILSQFLRRDPNHNGQLTRDEDRQSEQLASNELSLKEAVSTKQFWLTSALQFIRGFLLITATVHIVPHATDLGISNLGAAGILAIMGGTSIIGRIAIGIIGDSFGIRNAFIISFIAVAASYFWLPSIEATWMLYLFAIIFGIFNNAGILGPSLVTKLFGLKEHGLIFGALDFIFCIGSATGPLLAGYLFDTNGSYTSTFLICGALGITAVILSSLLRPTRIAKYLVES